jgi:hypothetical protein
LSVQYARAADLGAGLRRLGNESQLIVSSLVERKAGDALDVGLSFSDGTDSVNFRGIVKWCRNAPPGSHVPFLVGVGLDLPTTLVARRVASGNAKRARRPRKHDRYDTSILIGVNTGNSAGPGRIEDLSLSGARIVADLDPLPERGATVTLEFVEARLRLKTRPLKAKVMWVSTGPGANSFGVQFASMDLATREVIQREVADASIGKKPKP